MKMFKVLCLFIVALVNPILAMLFIFFPKMQNIFHPMGLLIILGSFVPGILFLAYQNSTPDFWFRFFNSGLFLTLLLIFVPVIMVSVILLISKRNRAKTMKNLRQQH